MQGDNALEKTNRVNVLFDFYGSLLTEKQQTFLKCYYQDDFSLGEIAGDFEISRQAVYEHLKRAEQVLEEYEQKLRLVARHEFVQTGLNRLELQVADLEPDVRLSLQQTIDALRGAERDI
ncbi:MAG: YlxM family DNA-binding protein [Candidatus Cohnella colombiensis]|uniref:UPF0122 protein P0Y55_09300 n=1 Tax=Candidatus Cohnella colombiensis TaxID=3121368 RepID=A0AA95F0B0_9BACL|nr:MAG: YlxM family DNA-binding protein [Cohnella sp.]